MTRKRKVQASEEVEVKKEVKPRRKRTRKTTEPKPEPVVAEEVKKEEVGEVDEDDNFAVPMSIQGELFWEYRAKLAEWDRAYIESSYASAKLNKEKADPKYRVILALLASDKEKRVELGKRGNSLRKVQERVAESLGLSYEDFTKKCGFDDETGVVKLLD